jgi:hypothetical protein
MKSAALAFAVALGLSCTAFAQTTTPATRPAMEEPEEVRLSVGRDGEYDALIADLKLAGDQLAEFRRLDAERRVKLQAFVDSPDGVELIRLREQLAAARRDKKRELVAPLRAQIEPYSKKYWEVRNQTRLDLLAVLSETQQKQTIGFSLFSKVQRGMGGTKLDEQQALAARSICDDIAAAWWSKENVAGDPFFRNMNKQVDAAIAQIRRDVLTETK